LLAIVPMQDVLGLGSEARFNTPGTARGNWRWRLSNLSGMDAAWNRARQAIIRSERQPAPARCQRLPAKDLQ